MTILKHPQSAFCRRLDQWPLLEGANLDKSDVHTYAAAYKEVGTGSRSYAAPDVTSMSKTGSPTTIIRQYRVLTKIGEGGMGEVYLAQDTKLGRKVALKVLPRDVISNPERLHRFEREAQAASALNQPNIITIHEIGSCGDTHFIVTEFIEGETLRRKLQRTRLEIEETLEIATQIAAALDAAHRSGITHRDIKPENIMVRED
ncbi:MAG TPA: serine/threonine-protein kinase, partial [Pyrinomonadaceae bacterium]|nr:serine/threonine-protein kinase [Pyrinomonadaceae bacterium]